MTHDENEGGGRGSPHIIINILSLLQLISFSTLVVGIFDLLPDYDDDDSRKRIWWIWQQRQQQRQQKRRQAISWSFDHFFLLLEHHHFLTPSSCRCSYHGKIRRKFLDIILCFALIIIQNLSSIFSSDFDSFERESIKDARCLRYISCLLSSKTRHGKKGMKKERKESWTPDEGGTDIAIDKWTES